MELTWRPDRTASWLHAVAALWRGRTLLDQALAEALGAASQGLRETLETHRVPTDEFLHHAVAAAHGASLRELAQTATANSAGPEKANACAAEITTHLNHLQGVFERAVPGVAEQLRLRVEPLRLQWEARGPGLLAALGRSVGPDVLVEQARVALVHPVLGGGGTAHHRYNTVSFEAVLTNPLAELPEVVRLGWLLGQLNLDLPACQGELPRDRTLALGSLALAVGTLAAAEEVELARADAATLRAALVAWNLAAADGRSLDATVSTLVQWWDVYRQRPPSLRVALAALDQMLA